MAKPVISCDDLGNVTVDVDAFVREGRRTNLTSFTMVVGLFGKINVTVKRSDKWIRRNRRRTGRT